MTQPTKQFNIWQRLYQRFLIEPFPVDGEGPAVSMVIQPVTDADALLRNTLLIGVNVDLTAAAGTYVNALSVTLGKIWILKGVWRDVSIANTQIRIDVNDPMNLSIQSTAEEFVSINDMRLPEGSTLGLVTSGNAGDTAVLIRAIVEEEDVF